MASQAFKTLYEHCQTLEPKVSRKAVIDKIKSITGQNVRVIKTSLDTSQVRGFFLSVTQKDHPWVRDNGYNVIVLARGLNTCWERFISVKEAMHLLDEEVSLVKTAEEFEDLLTSWTPQAANAEVSIPQQMSDLEGMMMALACLCPEHKRLEFIDLTSKSQIDNYGIALQLKIPEAFVPVLLGNNFERWRKQTLAV